MLLGSGVEGFTFTLGGGHLRVAVCWWVRELLALMGLRRALAVSSLLSGLSSDVGEYRRRLMAPAGMLAGCVGLD